MPHIGKYDKITKLSLFMEIGGYLNPKLREKTRESLTAVLLIGFIMGVIITVSEPDLQVLAEQVPSVPNMALILTVAVGVVALVALTPLIAIQIMGLVYRFKADKVQKSAVQPTGVTADSDSIVDF